MLDVYPMLLKPYFQSYLWGGNRLGREFGKANATSPTTESWELVGRENEKSTMVNGPLAGKALLDLRQIDALAYRGTHCQQERFLLLLKTIDAERDLSIQVHPSEETVVMDVGEQGKAKIQQNSDTTFRIYNYLRRNACWKMRQLHLQRAKTVIDYTLVIQTERKVNNGAGLDGFSISEMYPSVIFGRIGSIFGRVSLFAAAPGVFSSEGHRKSA